MMCAICKSQPATIQFTDVVNGVPQSRNICAGCIKGILHLNVSPMMDDMFKSFDSVMKSFDDAFKSLDKTPKAVEITCSDCGMTLSKFRQLGRFGCAKDYELFHAESILEKIHGTSVHMGKSPQMPGDKAKKLKKDMEAAVKSEDYEKAALIRDEIKKLEIK